jgi:hypothetical protein
VIVMDAGRAQRIPTRRIWTTGSQDLREFATGTNDALLRVGYPNTPRTCSHTIAGDRR